MERFVRTATDKLTDLNIWQACEGKKPVSSGKKDLASSNLGTALDWGSVLRFFCLFPLVFPFLVVPSPFRRFLCNISITFARRRPFPPRTSRLSGCLGRLGRLPNVPNQLWPHHIVRGAVLEGDLREGRVSFLATRKSHVTHGEGSSIIFKPDGYQKQSHGTSVHDVHRRMDAQMVKGRTRATKETTKGCRHKEAQRNDKREQARSLGVFTPASTNTPKTQGDCTFFGKSYPVVFRFWIV